MAKDHPRFRRQESYTQTSVVYEMVSNVPKSLYAVEDQTRLDLECVSKENIERYLHSASAIDSLLLLDRLRQVRPSPIRRQTDNQTLTLAQDVLLAENFAKQQTLCKATSAPDITSAKRKKVGLALIGSIVSIVSLGCPSLARSQPSRFFIKGRNPACVRLRGHAQFQSEYRFASVIHRRAAGGPRRHTATPYQADGLAGSGSTVGGIRHHAGGLGRVALQTSARRGDANLRARITRGHQHRSFHRAESRHRAIFR